jgi:hypothetical protein
VPRPHLPTVRPVPARMRVGAVSCRFLGSEDLGVPVVGAAEQQTQAAEHSPNEPEHTFGTNGEPTHPTETTRFPAPSGHSTYTADGPREQRQIRSRDTYRAYATLGFEALGELIDSSTQKKSLLVRSTSITSQRGRSARRRVHSGSVSNSSRYCSRGSSPTAARRWSTSASFSIGAPHWVP